MGAVLWYNSLIMGDLVQKKPQPPTVHFRIAALERPLLPKMTERRFDTEVLHLVYHPASQAVVPIHYLQTIK